MTHIHNKYLFYLSISTTPQLRTPAQNESFDTEKAWAGAEEDDDLSVFLRALYHHAARLPRQLHAEQTEMGDESMNGHVRPTRIPTTGQK
jgi:hypothetical protein